MSSTSEISRRSAYCKPSTALCTNTTAISFREPMVKSVLSSGLASLAAGRGLHDGPQPAGDGAVAELSVHVLARGIERALQPISIGELGTP